MHKHHLQQGFSLLFVVLVLSLLLSAVLGLSALLSSEARNTSNLASSQRAFYAADAGIEKTLYYDKKQIPNGATEGLCNICNSCTDCTSCQATELHSGGCDVNTCNACQITYTTTLSGVSGSFAVTATVTSAAASTNKVCVVSNGRYADSQHTRNACYTVVTGPPPVAVTTDSASYDTTTGNASLSGSLTNLPSGGSAEVYFAWSQSLNSDGTLSNPADTNQQQTTVSGSFGATLDAWQLSLNTTYYYQAAAVYNGNTILGSVKSFTTPAAGPPPTVLTDSASSITSSSAKVNGSLNNLPSGGSADVYFAWSQTLNSNGTLSNPTDTSQQQMTTSGAFNADLSGLSSSTTYYYQALADYDGATYSGAVESFITSSPIQITTNSASNITGNAATLNGSLGDTNGYSVQVYFAWGTSQTNLSNSTSPQKLSASGEFSAGISDLSGGTTYYYQAVAVYNSETYSGDVLSFATSSPVQVITVSASEGPGNAFLQGEITNLPNSTSAQVYMSWSQSLNPDGTLSSPSDITSQEEQIPAPGGYFEGTISPLPSTDNATYNATYYYQAVGIFNGATITGVVKSFTIDCKRSFDNNLSSAMVQDYQAAVTDSISGSTSGSISGFTSGSADYCGEYTLRVYYGTSPTAINNAIPYFASTFWPGLGNYSYTFGGSWYYGSSPPQYTGEIYELTPSTTYYYEAKLTSIGLNWTSPVESFTTLSSSDNGVQVFNGGYSCTYDRNASSYTATINGSIKNLPTGSTAPVWFTWGSGYSANYLTNATSHQQISQSGGFNATITGLQADYPYIYQTNSTYQGESLLGRLGQPAGYVLTCP